MDRERERQALRLFQEVIAADPGERAALLAAACGGDAKLRAEVEALLREDGDPVVFLRDDALAPPRRADGVAPERIGPYRVLRPLGAGGMGIVYEAEQDNPRRRVALKVLYPWLSTSALRARFAREVDLLGRLQHPGIAQIHQAGQVDGPAGPQPYFAMELVDGPCLADHARHAGLDLRARLALFARVCDAAHHAHENGVVHRDLKPGNILVDARGQPKILDFGIARAVGGDDAPVTRATETGSVLGTLQYMSPEQASGRTDLDRRTDVWSLGVIGYELLAGRLPLDLAGKTPPQVMREIVERDAPPASRHRRELRGDVETILARMLERDRARRYPTADAAAEDVRRHLRSEPIQARPTSALYQIGRFARRHRALVGGLCAVFVALLSNVVVLYHQARHDRTAREAAEFARDAAELHAERGDLLAASLRLRAGDFAGSRRLLDGIERLRDTFTWRHLDRAFDDCVTSVQTPGKRLDPMAFSASGDVLAFSTNGPPILWTPPDGQPEAILLEGGHAGIGITGAADVLILGKDGALTRGPPRADAAQAVPVGRHEGATWAALSPRGDRLVRIRAGKAELVEAATSRVLGELPISLRERPVAAFSPDGKRVITAVEGRYFVHDAATGERVTTLPGGPWPVVTFSADGRRVATSNNFTQGSSQNAVELRDAATLEVVHRVPGYEEFVMGAAFSADGGRLAVATWDRKLHLIDAGTGGTLAWLRGARGVGFGVAFSADGTLVCTSTSGGMLHLFDVANLEPDVLRGHSSYVYPVAFSHDGRLLASGSWDKTIRLWEAATGRCVAVLRGHGGYIHALAFTPDGATLISSAMDDSVRLWDVATGRERGRLDAQGRADVNAVAVRPDGKRVALAGVGSAAGMYLLDDHGALVTRIDSPGGQPAYVIDVDFSADGATLVFATRGGSVARADGDRAEVREQRTLPGIEITGLDLSPDGDRVAVTTQAGPILLLDAARLEVQAVLHGHVREAFSAVFSPDGRMLASGGRDGVVRMWDVASGDLVAELSGHQDYVWSVAWSPDGSCLASGSGDRTVRLWDSAPRSARLLARCLAERRRAAVCARVREVLAEEADPAAAAARLHTDPLLDHAARLQAGLELLAILATAEDP